MECPVCNAFSCDDPNELERHVDDCLNRGDALLAAKLAAQDSMQSEADAALAARLAAEDNSSSNSNINSSSNHSKPLELEDFENLETEAEVEIVNHQLSSSSSSSSTTTTKQKSSSSSSSSSKVI